VHKGHKTTKGIKSARAHEIFDALRNKMEKDPLKNMFLKLLQHDIIKHIILWHHAMTSSLHHVKWPPRLLQSGIQLITSYENVLLVAQESVGTERTILRTFSEWQLFTLALQASKWSANSKLNEASTTLFWLALQGYISYK